MTKRFHPQTRKRALSRHWIYPHLVPGIPPLKNVNYKCLLFKLPSNLLQKPELRKTDVPWEWDVDYFLVGQLADSENLGVKQLGPSGS
jgi:hypothetical protein